MDASVSSGAVAESAFFTALPPELRARILATAFGGLVVHVYHPSAYPADVSPSLPRDGRGRCHGRLCDADPDRDNPSIDSCLRDHRRQRHVGAVGWLVSCRRAFEEGSDVLYGTNTFRISLETLEPGLAYYLPAYSLCMVKSLELVLDPRVLGISQPGIRDAVPRATGKEERLLEALFRSMEPALLGLQKLYVGFCGGLGFWNHDPYSTPKQRYQNYRAHLLPLVDDAARAFGSRLREMELGLPLSSFWAHFVTGLGAGVKFQAPSWQPGRWPQGGYHARQRIWRSVSSASEGQPAGTEAELGYWITETWSDTPDGWMLDNDRYWE